MRGGGAAQVLPADHRSAPTCPNAVSHALRLPIHHASPRPPSPMLTCRSSHAPRTQACRWLEGAVCVTPRHAARGGPLAQALAL